MAEWCIIVVYIPWRRGVERTQIYLTKRQRDELAAIARAAGRNKSELIREAVDRLIDQAGGGRRESVLREVAGMWKNRRDLPDFGAVRAGWDRD
jgi:Arc/MetJ-type ribon-helix-helix transcriptional regulator